MQTRLIEGVSPFVDCRLLGNIYRTAPEGNVAAAIHKESPVTSVTRIGDLRHGIALERIVKSSCNIAMPRNGKKLRMACKRKLKINLSYAERSAQ